MKESNILFCKQIPDSWESIPNKYLFTCHSHPVGKASDEYQLLSLTTAGVKEKDINSGGGKVPENYEKYQTVEPGDMIFCLFDLDVSAVFAGLSSLYGMITSAYDVFRPNSELMVDSFCDFWFQYVFSNRYYKIYSKNIRYTISGDMFNSIRTPVPSIVEQKKIALFLTQKVEQINSLIEIEKKQIEALKEYRRAIITRATNKGLSNNANTKNSGVYWIGDIPKGWETTKLKYAYFNRIEKYAGGAYEYVALENIESMSGRYIETETNSNYLLDGSILAKKGDVIFGKLRPYLGKALLVKQECYVSSEFAVFNSDKNLPAFLKYLFLSSTFIDVINSSTKGTKMPRASVDFINNLTMALPPVDEQIKIVDFLDEKCSEIDEAISVKLEKIKRISEYKSSLIYEYVTGKKEVN